MAKIKIDATSFVDTKFVIAVYAELIGGERRFNILLGDESCGYLGKIVSTDKALAEVLTVSQFDDEPDCDYQTKQ